LFLNERFCETFVAFLVWEGLKKRGNLTLDKNGKRERQTARVRATNENKWENIYHIAHHEYHLSRWLKQVNLLPWPVACTWPTHLQSYQHKSREPSATLRKKVAEMVISSACHSTSSNTLPTCNIKTYEIHQFSGDEMPSTWWLWIEVVKE